MIFIAPTHRRHFLSMNELRKRKPTRQELPQGSALCDFCTAKCCKYFALPIDTPKTYEDFQYIRWYLLHDAASVFVDDGIWYLLVQTQCKHLQSDNRCGIYETRPTICSEYSTDKCEYDDSWTYERYFETAEQVDEFCDALFARPGQKNFRSPQPPMFPVIQDGRPTPPPIFPLSVEVGQLISPSPYPLPRSGGEGTSRGS